MPKLTLNQVWGRFARFRQPAAFGRFFKGGDYLAEYAAHSDHRVAQDPRAAIGGMWEEIGSLQFEFLVAQGLRPEHRLLDIGCGTLRGGRHFIRYLDGGNYAGIDIAPACIAAGKALVAEEGLAAKRPRLVLNEGRRMDFAEFPGETFDILLAQSVFTHLSAEIIKECFAHVGERMGPASAFFFTFFEAREPERLTPKDFAYPFGFFEDVGTRHGFEVANLSYAYPHPRSQQMARAKRLSGSPDAA